MQAQSSVLLSISFVLAVSSAQAADPVAYDFGGRMGLYHQSWILEKTPLTKQDTYKVRTRRVDNTGGVETQDGEVDCDPANPSVTGDWGKFEGKVFDAGYEVSGASESVYNLLWAVCRNDEFKSFGNTKIYQGFVDVPVAETRQDGRDYKLHLVTQAAVASFWAVRKVTLEYRSGDVRGRKPAYVFCDYDLPTVTVDGKTHELSGTLFVEKPDGERKLGTWEHVWIATCIGRSRFEPGESGKAN